MSSFRARIEFQYVGVHFDDGRNERGPSGPHISAVLVLILSFLRPHQVDDLKDGSHSLHGAFLVS